MVIQTAERSSQHDLSDNFVYQRCAFGYLKAAKYVSGKVLEIGTGNGYGIDMLAPKVDHLLTIDKFECQLDFSKHKNVEFRKLNVPPFKGIPDNTFDYVVSFHVIEHIEDDNTFVAEMHRVLKDGGKCILSTPHAPMSLTRNPWHIREYTAKELDTLLLKYFSSAEKLGISGNETVMTYYRMNEESVKKITRFDILNLQYKLPRKWLQWPYDILNRYNRKKLLKKNADITSNIKIQDYLINPVDNQCLDLFFIAIK